MPSLFMHRGFVTVCPIAGMEASTGLWPLDFMLGWREILSGLVNFPITSVHVQIMGFGQKG